MNKLLCLCISTMACTYAMAQPAADSSLLSKAITHAVSVYHSATDDQSFLYNGPQHLGYDPHLVGSPYYDSINFRKGTINYDSVLFQNIDMLYDEITDKVIVQHPVTNYKFELIGDKVVSFSLAGHHFIHLKENAASTGLRPGFYDLLVPGATTVLARRGKKVEELIQGTQVIRRVDSTNNYFAVRDNKSYPISNQRSLLNLLKDHKKEVQQYLRKNKIKFRNDPETAIVKAVDYYNQIPH